MKTKNGAVTDHVHQEYINGNKNMYDHHRQVMNNDVKHQW